MHNDTRRAEAWQQSYADRAAVVSIEVRRRKAAEAELDELRAYVEVLEGLLDAANERACNGECYIGLLPGDRAWAA